MNKKDNKDGLSEKDKVLGIIGLIFIIILVIIVRISPTKANNNPDDTNDSLNNNVTDNSKDTNNSNDTVNDNDDAKDNYFLKIDSKNYNYTYTVYINGKKEILTGSVYNDKNKFTLISDESSKYLIVSDNLLKFIDGSYKNVDSKRDYLKYVDIDNIKSLLDISEGVKQDDKIKYNITVFDLLDKYEDINYNSFAVIDDDMIEITLSDNYIKSIEINYSNYYKYINSSNTELKFKLEFNDYGNVIDFDV